MTTEQKKLTNLQVEMLKLFACDLSDAQLLEIKALPANYFTEKASGHMDALWEERGWRHETMEAWGKAHLINEIVKSYWASCRSKPCRIRRGQSYWIRSRRRLEGGAGRFPTTARTHHHS